MEMKLLLYNRDKRLIKTNLLETKKQKLKTFFRSLKSSLSMNVDNNVLKITTTIFYILVHLVFQNYSF